MGILIFVSAKPAARRTAYTLLNYHNLYIYSRKIQDRGITVN
jgi:hypothetical protein